MTTASYTLKGATSAPFSVFEFEELLLLRALLLGSLLFLCHYALSPLSFGDFKARLRQ